MVRSKMLERSAWWSESFCPEPGVLMISTSRPWSRKKPSSRATSSGRSWIAFIMEALTFLIGALFPGAVVHRVFKGRVRHRHVPLHRPAVGVVPALARIRRWRAVQQAPGLELFGLEKTTGLTDEVVDVGPRILLDLLDRACLRPEHLLQR